MLIIPVIDLSSGLVVHATGGERKSYQPIKSVLSINAEPSNVISSFLELYPFKVIYIADLDAIQKTGSQIKLINELAKQYKQCHFWVDAGIDTIQSNPFSSQNINLVLGSENKLTESKFSTLINKHPDLILSLDFDKHDLIENKYLLNNTALWPKQIIVMSLSHVGTNQGFDEQCLSNIVNMAGNRNIYAAGGVRNLDDLNQISLTTASGVLLATALHNGVIKKEALKQFLNNQ